MRLCQFDDGKLGLIEGDMVRDVSAALATLPASAYPFPRHDVLIENLAAVRAEIDALPAVDAMPLSSVRLQSPVRNAGKLVAAPVNYQAHLDEAVADEATFSRAHVRKIQETGLFLKATSSLIGMGSAIEIRHPDRRTDHEIELAVIIGRTGRDISVNRAREYVAGYSIGLDITIRGPEERSLRKSLDTYSVLGPALVTADEIPDPSGLELLLTVDGVVRQRANTRDLIMTVDDLIAFASSFYTLYPGDVLYTGTPEGVGPIMPGETIEASIEKVGAISVAVVAA